MHSALSSFGLKKPALHTWQEVDPVAGANLPFGQAVQKVPLTKRNEPRSHLTHCRCGPSSPVNCIPGPHDEILVGAVVGLTLGKPVGYAVLGLHFRLPL